MAQFGSCELVPIVTDDFKATSGGSLGWTAQYTPSDNARTLLTVGRYKNTKSYLVAWFVNGQTTSRVRVRSPKTVVELPGRYSHIHVRAGALSTEEWEQLRADIRAVPQV